QEEVHARRRKARLLRDVLRADHAGHGLAAAWTVSAEPRRVGRAPVPGPHALAEDLSRGESRGRYSSWLYRPRCLARGGPIRDRSRSERPRAGEAVARRGEGSPRE